MAEEVENKETETKDVDSVKPNLWWIRNSKGYGSVTLTFVTIAFIVVTLAYIASIVEKVGPLTMRPFDSGACAAYFTPLLALYFGRKWSDSKKEG